ncbi:MAG TPA: hypothetical protein VND64_22285 [Pirellulales bacterium]|nr:hypothetical protein [Pirellulales bacterium]
MSRRQTTPTWPFLVILAGLFVLSVASPREWEIVAHQRRADARSSQRRRATATAAAPSKSLARTTTWREKPDGQVGEPLPTTMALAVPPLAHEKPPILITADSSSVTSTPSHRDDAIVNRGPAASDEPAMPAPSIQRKPLLGLAMRPSADWPRHDWRMPTAPARGRRPAPLEQAPAHWENPAALLENLESLAWDCESCVWASRASDLLRELARIDGNDNERAEPILAELRSLAGGSASAGRSAAPKIERARYALARRLELWELVVTAPMSVKTSITVATKDRFAHPRQLLTDLERFEQTGLPSDGARLARHARATTPWPGSPHAGERIESWLEFNYRNSNLRLVVTAELLNRLVPKQPPVEAPVRDRILGVPTHGTSTTTAELGVRLIPDSRHLRFALEAKGLIFARTTSKSGPATFYNHSDATFVASKVVEIGPSGLRTWPAEAEATNSPKLRGVRTDYDDVPLLGSFVERIARNKHAESQGAVRRIARQRVESRVEEEMDATVGPRVEKVKGQFSRGVLEPLEGLALAPTVIEMQTTPDRVTVRLRLASDEQLAGFTPRPRAPGDSLASVQVHQSLLNNVGERLRLDGHTFTLPQLQQRLAESFHLPPETFTGEFPDDLRIGFAAENSVLARFVEGRIELTLAIAELHRHPAHWRDFTVRVYYKPQHDGLDLRFVRDGTVQLRGERFGAQPQIALRGIFSKIFSQDRGLSLIDPKLVDDPRLADLTITQCLVTDGWLGFAIGPRRRAQHPNVARAKPEHLRATPPHTGKRG